MAWTSVQTITSYDAFYSDLLEWVPDLMWPQSNYTYGQMRTDPQLRAVLAAYTLPIRRADWSVDPRGASVEATRMVADALGLPILGDHEYVPQRPPLRWSELIRLTLLGLTWGHMGFEKVWDTSDGRTARLTRLAERLPVTIYEIGVNDDDSLAGIRQHARGSDSAPFIPAKDLVWYAHDREGASWQGQSLLRPAFGPWLMKRELWRVNATSLRRFGMGVPVVQPPLGATPQQIAEASQLAGSLRVGDQAGVGLPPGFTLALQGVTGSVPDPLGFIEYLDQQMTRSALAGIVDLGNTAHGSRALGDTFVDLLMLSLQSIAEEVAAVLTTDVAADVIALNYGEDSPIPTLVVGDVGTRHEVTAAALDLLLKSGALTGDDALEHYVREAYGLPQRTTPRPAPVLPAPVPTAAASRRKVRAAAGWPFSRPPTPVEIAAKTDFPAVDKVWTNGTQTTLAKWKTSIKPAMVQALRTQVAATVKTGDPTKVADFTVDTSDAETLLGDEAWSVAGDSAAQQLDEADAQGVTVPGDPTADPDRVAGMAAATAALMGAGLSQSAARRTVAGWGVDVDPEALADDVATFLDGLTDAAAEGFIGGLMNMAQNDGRFAVLDAAPQTDAHYYASEVMDHNTCSECAAIDGTEFGSLDEAEAAYTNGGYNDCEGGLRCRGIIVTVWGDGA